MGGLNAGPLPGDIVELAPGDVVRVESKGSGPKNVSHVVVVTQTTRLAIKAQHRDTQEVISLYWSSGSRRWVMWDDKMGEYGGYRMVVSVDRVQSEGGVERI